MIVRLARTLDPFTFAEKYPIPHVIIGHYNPHEQIDEEGTGQPSYFKLLRTCQDGLSLSGECTYSVDMSAASIKLRRPVFFGENGHPARQYEIDGYHPAWRCGIEIEAGRAWMGNAIYRDLVQAMVMVDLDHLILAVPLLYRYKSGGRDTASKDYDNTISVADAIFGHTRIRMPYTLTVIGY